MGVALPLYGNGSQTLHTVLPLGARQLRRFFTARRVRRRAHPRAVQPELLHARTVRAPREHRRRRRHTTRCSLPVACATSCRLPRALAQPARRPHRRLRGLHRLARPRTSRVRLARHPERHRRAPLLARGGADRRAARERRARSILFLGRFDPRNGLGDMLDAFSQLWRAREGRCGCASSATGRCGRYYQTQARRAAGRARDLGRTRRLDTAALLRVRRHPLHALPARVASAWCCSRR